MSIYRPAIAERRTLLIGSAIALSAGVFVVLEPSLLVPLVLAGLLVILVPPQYLALVPLVTALGGTLLFGYGFANLGLPGAVPIPLADLCLATLLVIALAGRTRSSIPTDITLALAALLGFAALRLLLHDYRIYGSNALRDFTTPLEMSFLFVGVWVVRKYGLVLVVRVLTIAFALALGYFLLYPARATLASIPIVVGLQHPVPLLGQYSGAGTAAAAGLFFFAFVRPVRGSQLLAAAFATVVIMLQSRGLFIAVPLAALVVWTFAGDRGGMLRRRLISLVFVGCAASGVLFFLAPQGRMGPVNPSFLFSQVQTLFGNEGPGAGSIDGRIRFMHSTLEMVHDTKGAWLIGVGLGPDLTGGFQSTTGELVRKPHDDYLESFARLGILGLSLFSFILVRSFAASLRSARRFEGQAQRVLWFIVATSTVYLVIAATQPLLAFPYGTVPLFLFFGVGLGIEASTSSADRQTHYAILRCSHGPRHLAPSADGEGAIRECADRVLKRLPRRVALLRWKFSRDLAAKADHYFAAKSFDS